MTTLKAQRNVSAGDTLDRPGTAELGEDTRASLAAVERDHDRMFAAHAHERGVELGRKLERKQIVAWLGGLGETLLSVQIESGIHASAVSTAGVSDE